MRDEETTLRNVQGAVCEKEKKEKERTTANVGDEGESRLVGEVWKSGSFELKMGLCLFFVRVWVWVWVWV